MKTTFSQRRRTKPLIRWVGFIIGVLILAGCNAAQYESAGGTALAGEAQARTTKTAAPVYTRHNSVLVSDQRIPVEVGLPFPIGTSVAGRILRAYRFGTGPVFVALIGGIHGSYEANTTMLATQFTELLRGSPEIVPSAISVFIIPAMNPDGLERTGARGRVNANQVDLNRNWGCDWVKDTDSYLGVPFSTGSSSFSEPETRAVRDFLLQNDFKIVVFYHSRGAVVFHGECGETGQSVELAEAVSEATGYPVVDSAEYPVTRAIPGSITGEGADYFDSQGLSAIDVELSSHDRHKIDWERNRRGLLAIMDYAVRIYAPQEISKTVTATPPASP